MQLTEPCPKCGNKHRPYELHITTENDCVLYYKCTCGRKWRKYRVPKGTIRVIGEAPTLTLREYLGEGR